MGQEDGGERGHSEEQGSRRGLAGLRTGEEPECSHIAGQGLGHRLELGCIHIWEPHEKLRQLLYFKHNNISVNLPYQIVHAKVYCYHKIGSHLHVRGWSWWVVWCWSMVGCWGVVCYRSMVGNCCVVGNWVGDWSGVLCCQGGHDQ